MPLTGKLYRSVENLAREYTESAIETIADVMKNPFAEDKDRLNAANSLLDRGHGKPTHTVVQLPASRRQREALAAMTDDELLEVIQGEPLPALEHQPAAVDESDLSMPDEEVDPLCL